MTKARDLLGNAWEHSEAEDKIEHLVAYSPDLQAWIGKLSLRFISKSGLSEEFAAILEEIESQDLLKETPSRDDAPGL